MSDRNPKQSGKTFDPASQTGEDKGRIKKPQQTDATMAEKDLARGSEPATRARK
jgi:hypothetical protein